MSTQRQGPQMSPEQREQLQAGMATLREGNIEGAREILIELLEADPDLAPGHVGLGQVFSTEGDNVRALEHFHEAIAIDPSFSRAYLLSATSHEQLGEIDAAATDFDRAIDLNPTRSFNYLRKAQLFERNERPDDARKVLEDAVKRNPQDPTLRTVLAASLRKNGDTEGLKKELHRAVELQPGNWLPHFTLGTALLREGKLEEARDSLSKAADLEPEKASVHQALGMTLAKLGDHPAAALAYEAALLVDPADVRSIVGAATAKNSLGQHEEALELLGSAGRRGNRFVPLQRATGDTYMALGRYDDAIEIYRAIALNNSRLQEVSPEVKEIASAEVGDDSAAYAHRLQEALNAAFEVQRTEARTNPPSNHRPGPGRRRSGQRPQRGQLAAG